MAQVRTFLAIPLSAEIVQSAERIRRELANALPGVRWSRPENVHLTLRFFGNIPEESLEKIGEVMLSVVHFHPPFQMTVAGVGAFPSPARPRVIWLGIRECPPLLTLQAALEQGLASTGFPPADRAFSPHLTLGRCREPVPARDILASYQGKVCGTMDVEKIVLFESRLQPAGALHLPRKTAFLGRRQVNSGT